MFTLRCLAVSLSLFFVGYCLLSLAVAGGWKFVGRLGRSSRAAGWANLLLALRLLPLCAALAITLGYVLPSFLLLEPGSVQEPFGPMLVLLGGASLAGLLAGCIRAVMAQRKTSQMLSAWLSRARAMDSAQGVPVLQLPSQTPILTVAGVCAPKVIISETAVNTLTGEELKAAIRHELAHVRRRDNLKKLLFRMAVFPGMRRLESAWSEATEMAADDAAVTSAAEALDLASALIKLSRFAPVQTPILATGLMHRASATISARVERLFGWTSQPAENPQKSWAQVAPAVAILWAMAVTYTPLLSGMHRMTEWLVR